MQRGYRRTIAHATVYAKHALVDVRVDIVVMPPGMPIRVPQPSIGRTARRITFNIVPAYGKATARVFIPLDETIAAVLICIA